MCDSMRCPDANAIDPYAIAMAHSIDEYVCGTEIFGTRCETALDCDSNGRMYSIPSIRNTENELYSLCD